MDGPGRLQELQQLLACRSQKLLQKLQKQLVQPTAVAWLQQCAPFQALRPRPGGWHACVTANERAKERRGERERERERGSHAYVRMLGEVRPMCMYTLRSMHRSLLIASLHAITCFMMHCRLPGGEVEIGLGIHGEPGVSKDVMQPPDDMVKLVSFARACLYTWMYMLYLSGAGPTMSLIPWCKNWFRLQHHGPLIWFQRSRTPLR